MTSDEILGTTGGQEVSAHRIDGGAGLSARITTYGARLVELHVPGRGDRTDDVVLGFDALADYEETPTYFGATCGRYGNRIDRGRFVLEGTPVQVDCNEGRHHLHGGKDGWDRKVWTVVERSEARLRMTTTSPDAEMGFPGSCEVSADYEITGTSLRIVMQAEVDAPTVVNMVHHSYFNLAGHGQGDVLGQEMRIPADFYVPVDDELIATGEVLRVEGTPFDFRESRPIGARLDELPPVGAGVFDGGRGYDHNWCLRGAGELLREAVDVVDPGSGRRLVLRTTEPGLQMYTGGYLHEGIRGKGGVRYRQFAGFTLETQKFPGSPGFAHFPMTVVRPGEPYRHVMELDFSVV